MLSVGQFAQKAQVSARTVRYYESIGLLPAPSRGENNYRYYNQNLLERMNRIRDLQSLGFSLEEVKAIVHFSNLELREHLQAKLLEIDQEFSNLDERRERVMKLLSVSDKIETGEALTETERNFYMENIKEDILTGLRTRYPKMTDSALAYLDRDVWFTGNSQMGEFINAVKQCIEFAKQKNLILGHARGSNTASLSMFGLGFSNVDPLKYEMIPERISVQQPFFHIDVEFERGQEFVDFCRGLNSKLSCGEIQAFKMPLIDVVKGVHKTLGHFISYDEIDDNADVVLDVFRNADIENIFQFDFSPDALVMNYERFFPEYLGLEKITDLLRAHKDISFRDIINITALWRPHTPEMIERIDLYKKSLKKDHSYGFLSKEIEASLKPNHGLVLYHEDILKIMTEATGWDLVRSNTLRRLCFNRFSTEARDKHPDWAEFNKIAPKPIVDLVAEESKWTFCLPHAISFAKFTKQTAVLKTLHKEIYYAEIEKFEQKYGFAWDDIGIRIPGVSLHQG